MHICVYLYTSEFPSDEVIRKCMEPYNEYGSNDDDDDAPYTRPPMTWDFYQIGGRYGGKLKLGVDKSTEGKYEFAFIARTRRAGRLYRCWPLEEMTRGCLDRRTGTQVFSEDSMLIYMGMRAGYILVDGAWLPDVLNREEIADLCAAIIVDDQPAIVRKRWDGDNWITAEDFDDRAKAIMCQMAPDHYLTVIDCHW
jgi:hypothetical protein